MPNNASQPGTPSSKFAAWLGPCASLLCLVHCVGFALLALLAPSFSAILPHAEWVDAVVLATVGGSGAYALKNFRASRGAWILFLSLAVGALAFQLAEQHTLAHLTVVGLSLVQLPYLLKHFGARKAPPCCDHETPSRSA